MRSQVAFSEDELAGDAMDTVRANHCVYCRGCAVLEVENNAAAFFLFQGLEAFVEVCTFRGHSFDEFAEEPSAMYALHASWSLAVTDDLAFTLTLALLEKRLISIFPISHRTVIRKWAQWYHLRQHTVRRY